MDAPRLGDRVVLDPRIPFAVHTTAGEPLTVPRRGDREAAAFRPRRRRLAGYVVLDFDAFDAWYEEDERNVGHPRDPFHRIDIVHSSRHVRVELDGEVLAESSRAVHAVRAAAAGPLLPPAPRTCGPTCWSRATSRTFCAYKGEASYLVGATAADVAWTYRRRCARRPRSPTGSRSSTSASTSWSTASGSERPVTPWSPR